MVEPDYQIAVKESRNHEKAHGNATVKPVKQPFGRNVGSFLVVAKILSYLDYEGHVKVKLGQISKKTVAYLNSMHRKMLEYELVKTPQLIKQETKRWWLIAGYMGQQR